ARLTAFVLLAVDEGAGDQRLERVLHFVGRLARADRLGRLETPSAAKDCELDVELAEVRGQQPITPIACGAQRAMAGSCGGTARRKKVEPPVQTLQHPRRRNDGDPRGGQLDSE